MSATIVLGLRNRDFMTRELDIDFDIVKTEIFMLLALTLPVLICMVSRLFIFALYAFYDYHWFNNVDRGPVFANKLNTFALSGISSVFFTVSLIIKNSCNTCITYYIFSRLTGMFLSSVIFSVITGKIEVIIYRAWL